MPSPCAAKLLTLTSCVLVLLLPEVLASGSALQSAVAGAQAARREILSLNKTSAGIGHAAELASLMLTDCRDTKEEPLEKSIQALQTCIDALQKFAEETRQQRKVSMDANNKYAEELKETQKATKSLMELQSAQDAEFLKLQEQERTSAEAFSQKLKTEVQAAVTKQKDQKLQTATETDQKVQTATKTVAKETAKTQVAKTDADATKTEDALASLAKAQPKRTAQKLSPHKTVPDSAAKEMVKTEAVKVPEKQKPAVASSHTIADVVKNAQPNVQAVNVGSESGGFMVSDEDDA